MVNISEVMNVQYNMDPYSIPDPSMGGDPGLQQQQYPPEDDYYNGAMQPAMGMDEMGGAHYGAGMMANEVGVPMQMAPPQDDGVLGGAPPQPIPESPYLSQLIYERQNIDPHLLPQSCALLDMG